MTERGPYLIRLRLAAGPLIGQCGTLRTETQIRGEPRTLNSLVIGNTFVSNKAAG